MKGILFRQEMIQAIINGSKSVTRRVMKPQPDLWISDEQFKLNLARFKHIAHTGLGQRYFIGETVYIKEAHYRHGHYEGKRFIPSLVKGVLFDTPEIIPVSHLQVGWHKRSPLFMPAWAARHFIQITGVGAGRVQEITEEDAIAEGAIVKHSEDTDESGYSFRLGFIDLWDSINAKPKPVYVKDNGKKVISHYESYPWEEGDKVETYRGKPHYIHGNPWTLNYSLGYG